MDVPSRAWALTIPAIAGMLLPDFVGHPRKPHAPSLREPAVWSAVSIGIAVGFGLACSRQEVLRSSPAEDDAVEEPAPALR